MVLSPEEKKKQTKAINCKSLPCSYINQPPEASSRDSHSVLSFLSCQTNAGVDAVVVDVFGTDNMISPFLNDDYQELEKNI